MRPPFIIRMQLQRTLVTAVYHKTVCFSEPIGVRFEGLNTRDNLRSLCVTFLEL